MSASFSDDPTAVAVISGLDSWGMPYTPDQIAQLLTYRDLLIDWNANRMNLTRIVEPRSVGIQHFLDSLSILQYCDIPQGSSLLDVGTGAGLPGLALKIFRPDIQLTLLEATAKKLTFCEEACRVLSLQDVRLVHGRAESNPSPVKTGAFDTVAARAVADLSVLVQWCAPYVRKPGGQFIALKGSKAQEEIKFSNQILDKLGLTVQLIETDLGDYDHAHAIVRCAYSTGKRR